MSELDGFEYPNSEETISDDELDAEFEEIIRESESAGYISNLQQPRLNANKVRVAFFIGDRGSGKTTAMENDAELYYNEGMNVWYIWGSRSNENVFSAVNMNCKYKWEKRKARLEKRIILARTIEERKKHEKRLEELESRIHCNCHKAYPISWLVPDYWDFEGVKEYNTCWSGREEYEMALEYGWITKQYNELTLKEREKLEKRRLEKPKYLIKTDLIKICPFRVPLNTKDKEIFEKQFLKYVFDARDEHRWVVMNPLMFVEEKHKFATIGFIFEKIKFWMDMYFQPNTPTSVARLRGQKEPVPREQWTKKELSYDKVCLILPEIRTLAPPHKFSPEKQSTLAKRPLVDMIPELRHFRIWLQGDLQAYDDLNDSVRPMADFVVVKRGGKELLGPEWAGFVNKIDQLRKERLIAMSYGEFDDFKKAPFEFKNAIDKDLPMVSEIPKNKGYVVYRNGEFYLEEFKMAGFHHKSESETLQSVTGITWKLNNKLHSSGSVSEEEKDSSKRLKNYDEEKVMKYITKQFIITRKWPKAQENYKLEIQKGNLPSTRFEFMSKEVLSNTINKVPYLKSKIKYAKENRDKPIEDLIKGLD